MTVRVVGRVVLARDARRRVAPPRACGALLAGLLVLYGADVAAKPKLLLQDLEAQGVADAEASVITTSTCLALSKTRRHEVLCGDDIRTMMKFGALSSTFRACEGQACFSQISRALKARFVVSGAVSRLGDTFVLSLAALDTKRAKTIGRAEAKAPTLEQLQLQIVEAVSSLFPNKG